MKFLSIGGKLSDLILRQYQLDALFQIRKHYASGCKKVLLHMATGSGKTVIFSLVMKGIQQKGNKCVLAVKGRELVDNASQRLTREGVEHGVFMANHKGYNLDSPIQVCSIDTLRARKKKIKLPEANLVVIDEAHFATSPSFRWFIDEYNKRGAFFLSVTATPHVKEGLRHLADVCVYPITIEQLIEQKYLVSPRYFSPPSKINLSNVRIDYKTGDYNLSDLANEVENAHVSGDIIEHYRKLAWNRPAVLFAVNVEHSKSVVSELNAAGISALHIEANTKDADRKEALKKLETGEVKIISNVGILCTGVDMPYVSCIIMARPTKSYNLFIQQIGRGTRSYFNKEDFIVLDHANNIDEHGLIECERICNLDGTKNHSQKEPTVRCVACYHVWNPCEQWKKNNPELAALGKTGRDYICEGKVFKNGEIVKCGCDNTPIRPEKNHEIRENLGVELKEISGAEAFLKFRIQKFIEKSIVTALNRGYQAGWIYHRIKENFGEEIAKENWIKIKKRIVHN